MTFECEIDLDTLVKLKRDPRVIAATPYPRVQLPVHNAREILRDYGIFVPRNAESVDIRIKKPH